MLKQLHETVLALPTLLADTSKWDSLIVNRRKPFTYRVFTQIEGYRVCLHKFDPCHTHEAFFHPHPWPGAFIVMNGSYKMKVGLAPDRNSDPKNVMELIFNKHSMYEILNPLTFHSVVPLETTYTIMLNGEPWAPEVAHTQVRTTKGKDLDKMPDPELREHLNLFKEFVHQYATTYGETRSWAHHAQPIDD